MTGKSKETKFDFEIFMDNLITKGKIEKEKEITPEFKIKLRPLDVDEQIIAESVVMANNPYIPYDTVQKIRAISILSKAIISINSIPICKEDTSEKEEEEIRGKLYKKMMKLPGSIIDDAYNFYFETVLEKKKLYQDGDALNENIKNF